jgi:hypothetical protein
MKLLNIAFLMAFGLYSYASEANLEDAPPSYLKDGKIVVTLKNGKSYEFSTNEYKVVRRGTGKKSDKKAQPAQEEEPSQNRVRLMGGVGPNGFKTSVSPGLAHVETSYGVVGGLGYDRKLGKKYSINGSAYTNGTFSLGLGLDF